MAIWEITGELNDNVAAIVYPEVGYSIQKLENLNYWYSRIFSIIGLSFLFNFSPCCENVGSSCLSSMSLLPWEI